MASQRISFSGDDDALLMKFIATYNPKPRGRLGQKLYERLLANVEGKWSFASRHTLHSWRERYKTNQRWFDAKILQYQKKHGISADPSSPRGKGQISAGSQARLSRNSPPPPAGGSGSKKRAREVDAADLNLEPGSTKKKKRLANVRGDSDPQPHSVPPVVKPQNKGKLRAERSSSPSYEENRDLPVVGADDYTGALSGESDQGEENQSDGSNESSSPLKKTRSKPSPNKKNSSGPARVENSPAPEETSQPIASSSHQRQGRRLVHSSTTIQPTSKASSTARKLVVSPLQLSQEPTPPHTSSLSSPRSPLPRGRSHTTSPSPQSETVHQPQRAAPLKQKRPLSIKRSIVHEEEEDIFCTPPIRSPPSSPPPRAHARDAPRLVEGPYRSAYTRANGGRRLTPRGQRASGVRMKEEADGSEWPPRRDKRDASLSSPERSTTKDVDRASASASASVQHLDLRVLHSRKSVESLRAGGTSRTLEKKRRTPKSSTPPNLSEANKELVLALGLEEVYKRMADNHKFHVDIVREVAARQRSLEHADQVLRNMREAAEREYARMLEREFSATLGTGAHITDESDEEEEEEVAENLRNEESAPPQPESPYSNHSPSVIDGGGYIVEEVDADAIQELDEDVPPSQADSSSPGSPMALADMEWADDDDELLLDGDLVAHEELVRRKGLTSVKFRTADLYSLLLDS